MPEAPVPDAYWVADQSTAGTSTSSVSVRGVVGNAIPLQPSSRRIKFLIEWRDRTIPIVLTETETIGSVNVTVKVLNPTASMSDQNRISPFDINTISSTDK